MIPAISRRAALQGASVVVATAVLPGLGAVAAPPVLPDIETRLGAEAMACIRNYYALCRLGSPFTADGRFAMSNVFRMGLTRFLVGEDIVLIRRDQKAESIDEAHAQWKGSYDSEALGLFQTVLRQEIDTAFDRAAWRRCLPFLGELRAEPGAFAVLLTPYGDSLRRDEANALFREYWVV